MLCECGAPARGHVCQRGHRLEEDWSGYDAKRKGHSASSVIDALTRVGELAQHEGEIEYHTHPSVRGKAAPHCKTHGYLDVAGNPASGPRFLPSKEARQIAAKHIRQSHMNEGWSPQARAAALAAREHRGTAGDFGVGDEVLHGKGNLPGVVVAKSANMVHVGPAQPKTPALALPQMIANARAMHGALSDAQLTKLVRGQGGASYPKSAPPFKPRPPQELQLRGR